MAQARRMSRRVVVLKVGLLVGWRCCVEWGLMFADARQHYLPHSYDV